jgi:hypothetical protein
MAANNQTEEQLASTDYVQAYGQIRNKLWNKRSPNSSYTCNTRATYKMKTVVDSGHQLQEIKTNHGRTRMYAFPHTVQFIYGGRCAARKTIQ